MILMRSRRHPKLQHCPLLKVRSPSQRHFLELQFSCKQNKNRLWLQNPRSGLLLVYLRKQTQSHSLRYSTGLSKSKKLPKVTRILLLPNLLPPIVSPLRTCQVWLRSRGGSQKEGAEFHENPNRIHSKRLCSQPMYIALIPLVTLTMKLCDN